MSYEEHPLEVLLDAMREAGWTVAVHNDYRQNEKAMTFWLFTGPDGRFVKGEAESDREAVAECLRATESIV